MLIDISKINSDIKAKRKPRQGKAPIDLPASIKNLGKDIARLKAKMAIEKLQSVNGTLPFREPPTAKQSTAKASPAPAKNRSLKKLDKTVRLVVPKDFYYDAKNNLLS